MLRRILVGLILPLILMGSVTAHASEADAQINCLAKNIYFEAGNQKTAGKIAVAKVVMNRVKDGSFGIDPCAVIHQKSHGHYQFSWVRHNPKIKDQKLFSEVRLLAENVYNGKFEDPSHGSLFFHSSRLTMRHKSAIRIGELVFYKGPQHG